MLKYGKPGVHLRFHCVMGHAVTLRVTEPESESHGVGSFWVESDS